MSGGALRKFAAFSTDPMGGNPAGVWVGNELPDAVEMQRIAKLVGFSETAFVAPASGNRRTVRYFSPEMEVPFCGHATIATGVALADDGGDGEYELTTAVGDVSVLARTINGQREASLTSVQPQYTLPSNQLLRSALSCLGWTMRDLSTEIPPAKAFAGAWHLVLAVTERDLLNRLDYDFAALKQVMLQQDLITLQLIWREHQTLFHSRNPFPVGGVVEDPATGAAAAALGGYLREAALIDTPAKITIRQGEAMGRPSVLQVSIPEHGGIVVTGNAVAI